MSVHKDTSTLSPDQLLEYVLNQQSLDVLRAIAHERFTVEAQVINDVKESPFILWPAINRTPQPWLAALTGTIAKHELLLQDKNLTIICVPNSASWYANTLKTVFPQAKFPRVTKKLYNNPHIDNYIALEVPSYVHNRNMDGTRGTNTMYFFDQEMFTPHGTTLIVDDALAEGYTAIEIATFLKNQCSQDTIYFATPLAKHMQGGVGRLHTSGFIKGMSIVINVTETNGKGQPVQFT